MIFEKTLENQTILKEEPKGLQVNLDSEREYLFKRIKIAYSLKIKKISKSKLVKMAIDNLIKNVEEQDSEEEALEYLRELYKEAEF